MDIKRIRRELHKNPELSGNEKKTAEYIINILKELNADDLITDIGGHGIIASFGNNDSATNILMRCDMDAVPVDECNTFEYSSNTEHVSHACGHDGHMAIMIGLARRLSVQKISNNVHILFQPSEENGQGAENVLNDSCFPASIIDFAFALHNFPGYPVNTIILRNGIFAYASIGLEIKLKGESSHAAYPEKGNSPVYAMTDILREINRIAENYRKSRAYITIVNVNSGSRAFGTSPSDAAILLTLRSAETGILNSMKNEIEEISIGIAENTGLAASVESFEYFPECRNSDSGIDMIEKTAVKLGINTIWLEEPMRWSEDFAHFLMRYKGAIAGIGIGEEAKPLHSSSYDFNDSIIDPAIDFLYELISSVK